MAPVSNSPRVFPISCREIHLASSSPPLVILSTSLTSPSLLCSTDRQLFPEFIHASWWRGPHYPRWMDSSSIPVRSPLQSALLPSLAPPSSAPFFSFYPFSFFLFFFFFFKSCRLTEARRSFIRFSGACLLCPDHEEVSRSGERVLGGL